MPLLLCLVAALACIGLGGGFYETRLIDPVWPRNPALIQPARGGISRRRFWIPVHFAFELALVAALVLCWHRAEVRQWLLAALACHLVMRAWSLADFIPKALAFERAEPAAIAEPEARAWTGRSRLRPLLDLGTCATAFAALLAQAQP